MTTESFVHLHLHTEYSLRDSTVRIAELMQRCAVENMPAVAVTDRCNLFALVKFYKKAMAAGVKPIIGVDLRIANDEEPERPSPSSCSARTKPGIAISITSRAV